mmetsp:Transcript_26646/g.63302  ORF Transcript_26646/g.63302 Transcript_26646/m.63302 type:complete len:298 (-) Transcript_26646:175-1068(-)
MNTALVFVKPHAANDAVLELTKKHLGDKGIKIVREGELGAQEIKAKGIIDDHYAALAANAVKTLPKDLLVADANKAKFAQEYGKSWDTAVGDGSFLNLAQYQEKFPDLSAVEVEKRWRAGATVKLAPGNYVSKIAEDDVLVINGFYASMRDKFISPGARVLWMVVQFDEANLPWKDFRGSVLGATDPTTASQGSLRRVILEQWKELGLAQEPSTSDNGVHASAGPIEGLRERMIWLGVKAEEDAFGELLASKGVKPALVASLCNNQLVTVDGKEGPAFDMLEDTDSSVALQAILTMA